MSPTELFTPDELIAKGFAHPAEKANWPFPFQQSPSCSHEDYVRLPKPVQAAFTSKADENGTHFEVRMAAYQSAKAAAALDT